MAQRPPGLSEATSSSTEKLRIAFGATFTGFAAVNARRGEAVSARCMSKQSIGASARPFTNALTIILSIFAASGWCAEVRSWPPSFVDLAVVAMAAITLTAQQIANAMVAHAYYAATRRAWATSILAAGLSVAFAGVTAFGIDHAFVTVGRLMRERSAAPIALELHAAAADARAANARLMNLPTDIPASRLVALQAPLRAALEAADAKEADARARFSAATAPSASEDIFRRFFETLSLCEGGLYLVLAASQSHAAKEQSQSQSQSQRSEPSRETPRPSRRPGRGMLRALLGGAAFAWSAAAPAAARPPILPRATTSVVGAAPPPYAPTASSPPSKFFPGSAAPRVPRAVAGERDAGIRNGTPPPSWLDMARALRASGLSYRAIAARIDVPKSTVFRWLS